MLTNLATFLETGRTAEFAEVEKIYQCSASGVKDSVYILLTAEKEERIETGENRFQAIRQDFNIFVVKRSGKKDDSVISPEVAAIGEKVETFLKADQTINGAALRSSIQEVNAQMGVNEAGSEVFYYQIVFQVEFFRGPA